MGEKTTVINLRGDVIALAYDPDFVRIDRSTKWGNPFFIGGDKTRADVIVEYLRWLPTQPELLAALPELRGKTLGCWCAPEPCHGDVLALLADLTPRPDACPCGHPDRECAGGMSRDLACPAGRYRSG